MENIVKQTEETLSESLNVKLNPPESAKQEKNEPDKQFASLPISEDDRLCDYFSTASADEQLLYLNQTLASKLFESLQSVVKKRKSVPIRYARLWKEKRKLEQQALLDYKITTRPTMTQEDNPFKDRECRKSLQLEVEKIHRKNLSVIDHLENQHHEMALFREKLEKGLFMSMDSTDSEQTQIKQLSPSCSFNRKKFFPNFKIVLYDE